MAVFTSQELATLRSILCKNSDVQTWTKENVGVALQAIEDRVRMTATQNTIAGDIESAAPGVFSAQQKATLFGIWCVTAATRLGII